MSETLWAPLLFVALNVLDAFTTWLGIYRLPADIRGREANVLLQDIEKSFWSPIVRKAFFVVVGIFSLIALANIGTINILLAFRVLNIVMGVTVLNNSYVYLSRRITRRRTKSPVGVVSTLLTKCGMPQKLAALMSFYLIFGAVTVIAFIIASHTL